MKLTDIKTAEQILRNSQTGLITSADKRTGKRLRIIHSTGLQHYQQINL